MFKLLLLLFFLPAVLGATPDQFCRQMHALLVVGDHQEAKEIARQALLEYPTSKKIGEMAIACLAAAGEEEEMYAHWEAFQERFPEEAYGQELLEKMCWGILRKGRHALGTNTQLIAAIGAGLTQDMYAVSFLTEGMRHSNAVIRTLCVELAAQYGDIPLKGEITRLFKEEQVESVRLQVIRAIGKLRLEDLHNDLLLIVASPKRAAKEKLAAIEALVSWKEEISRGELERLAYNKRAGLRQLACEVIAHLELRKEADLLRALVRDAHPEVRAAAIRSMGLLRLPLPQIVTSLSLREVSPLVGVCASWATLLKGDERGARRWLGHETDEVRATMASAVAAAGPYGVSLATEMFEKGRDPFVKANLVLGLLGQREACDEGCRFLDRFLSEHREKLMLNKEGFFETLLASDVPHNPAIPNYPDVVDQTVRLELLNLLAILQYPKALEAIKGFLLTGDRGVTGIAAENLLGEGDETALVLVRQLLHDPNKRVRLEAALVLATWGRDPEALPTLLAVYPEGDRQLKIKILEALGRIRDKEAVPFLVERLKEPSQTMRLIAASILIQTLNG